MKTLFITYALIFLSCTCSATNLSSRGYKVVKLSDITPADVKKSFDKNPANITAQAGLSVFSTVLALGFADLASEQCGVEKEIAKTGCVAMTIAAFFWAISLFEGVRVDRQERENLETPSEKA